MSGQVLTTHPLTTPPHHIPAPTTPSGPTDPPHQSHSHPTPPGHMTHATVSPALQADQPLSSSQLTPQSTLPTAEVRVPPSPRPAGRVPNPNHFPLMPRSIHAPSHCVPVEERGAGRSVDPSMGVPRRLFSWVERPPRVSSRPRGDRGTPSLPPPFPRRHSPPVHLAGRGQKRLRSKGGREGLLAVFFSTVSPSQLGW